LCPLTLLVDHSLLCRRIEEEEEEEEEEESFMKDHKRQANNTNRNPAALYAGHSTPAFTTAIFCRGLLAPHRVALEP